MVIRQVEDYKKDTATKK
jgi:hypothetical protein